MTTETFDPAVTDAIEADWKQLLTKPNNSSRNVRAVEIFKRANVALDHPDLPVEHKRRLHHVRSDVGVQCFDMGATYNPDYPDDFPTSKTVTAASGGRGRRR